MARIELKTRTGWSLLTVARNVRRAIKLAKSARGPARVLDPRGVVIFSR